MKSDARWMTVLAWRVLVNAIIGGFFFAVVGVLCIGLTFGYLGALAQHSGHLGLFGARGGSDFEGALIGAKAGALSGFAGAALFTIIAIRAVPGPILEPFNAFIARVMLGQALGVASTLTSFFLFEINKANLKGQALFLGVIEDQNWVIFGTPVLMFCGAIAAALMKRDT